jgi:hypothetical protein
MNELAPSSSAVAPICALAIVNLVISPAATEADNAPSNPTSAQVADAEVALPVATVAEA